MTDKHNLTCGIIMPIAPMPGYTESHWQDVKNIIIESSNLNPDYNFKTEIVSNSDGEIDVIHKRIIQNLYNSDIVVCDISGKNPNVLFELGMRLTFDKPTVIIKDDQTDFIFDTGIIEHITYPKDLRFNKIVSFKNELSERIIKTYDKSISDPNFSTFLKNFGEFQVPNLEQTEVTDPIRLVINEIKSLQNDIDTLKATPRRKSDINNDSNNIKTAIYYYLKESNDLDKPLDILNKKEFQYMMEQLDIYYSNIPNIILVEWIQEIQNNLSLPF